MAKVLKWYLAILIGLAIMLGGLVWDAALHATQHAHLVVEALFDPTNPFENPAHAAIGIGLMWTTLATLSAFTLSWLEARSWRVQWKSVMLPIALWLGMGTAGVVALVVLAQTQ